MQLRLLMQFLLRTRNTFCAPQPRPQWTNCSDNYAWMHCACTKRPYFHLRSKIWSHHRVPRPWFP